MSSRRLADLSTVAVRALLDGPLPCVALLPVGSVEPHGPHLPLSTDTLLSEGAALLAVERLEASGVRALVAPSVAYGVTDFAAGFAGAVSVPAEALSAWLRAVTVALLDAGFAAVCLVNNHLEPAHDAAVRASVAGLRAAVASPLSRRWGRTLSDEYKSGACHAGRYETSLVLAVAPALVDVAAAAALPPLSTSLAAGIRAGAATFAALGLDRAYTGAPSEASAAEGSAMLARLATMIETEVRELLDGRGTAP